MLPCCSLAFMHARPSTAVKRASVMGIRVRREVLPPIARRTLSREASQGGERRNQGKPGKKKEGKQDVWTNLFFLSM